MTSTTISKDKQVDFARLIHQYEQLKPFLTDEQKYGIEFDLRIARFELNHPGKKYYLDQHLQPRLGIMKSPYCKLCTRNLDKMRKNDPRCRVIDFCSPNCRKEHNRRRKIYELELKEMTEGRPLMWEHEKDEKGYELPLQRKDMFYTLMVNNELIRHNYTARKSKWKSKQNPSGD